MNTLTIETAQDYYIADIEDNVDTDVILISLPDEWKCDYVNLVLWEDSVCTQAEKGNKTVFTIRRCAELFMREVQFDEDGVKFVELPAYYEGTSILIVQI